jgi:hypothetical protein
MIRSHILKVDETLNCLAIVRMWKPNMSISVTEDRTPASRAIGKEKICSLAR